MSFHKIVMQSHFASLLLAMSWCPVAAANCDVGPTHCVDTPEYRSALAAKKTAATRGGFPSRLVAIYDKVDHCEAAVRTAPDAFSLFRQDNNGNIDVSAWDAANERIAAKQLADNKLKACYVILSRHAFACGHAKPFAERADYNADLDLSMSMSVTCSQ